MELQTKQENTFINCILRYELVLSINLIIDRNLQNLFAKKKDLTNH